MTTSTEPIIMVRRINKTQYSARVEGHEQSVVITFRQGHSFGGNNYTSSNWYVHRPNGMFAETSFPAKKNSPQTFSKSMVAWIHDFVTNQS